MGWRRVNALFGLPGFSSLSSREQRWCSRAQDRVVRYGRGGDCARRGYMRLHAERRRQEVAEPSPRPSRITLRLRSGQAPRVREAKEGSYMSV
jgi:hypothetical protein